MEIKFAKLWKWGLQNYRNESSQNYGNEVHRVLEVKFAKLMKWCSQSYGNEVCKVVEMNLQSCRNYVCKIIEMNFTNL